jgi:hypothetical protein
MFSAIFTLIVIETKGQAWPGEDAMNDNNVETAQIRDTLKALEPSKPTELAVENGLAVLASLNRYAAAGELAREHEPLLIRLRQRLTDLGVAPPEGE